MAKKAATEARDGAVKRCIDAFYDAFVRRFNPPDVAERFLADRTSVPRAQMTLPNIAGGKDAGLMKALLGSYQEDGVLRLIDLYFVDCMLDGRVVRSDQTVGALYALAAYLVTRQHVPQGQRTTDNLDAASRATRRKE